MILTIAIPTIEGREIKYHRLMESIKPQLTEDVEVITLKDNREISIGEKRNRLASMAKGDYIVQVDDDDSISENYVQNALQALKTKPDCVGYLEYLRINGSTGVACHSNKYDDWGELIDGYRFVRTIFNKDIIRTKIVQKVGFSDLRFAEDHDFARRLKSSGLLKTEVFINEIMYIYNYLSNQNHHKRYGV